MGMKWRACTLPSGDDDRTVLYHLIAVVARAVCAALILLLPLSACGPVPPTKPPQPPTTTDTKFTVVVCDDGPTNHCTTSPKIANARLVIDGALLDETNDNGFAVAVIVNGSHQVRIEADGYEPVSFGVTLPTQAHRDIEMKRTAPPVSRVRTDGRFFVNDKGTYRGRWTSGLALLSRTAAERAAFLDWARSFGFDGVRVFAGDIGWANQTPASALANLPSLLAETQARGLYLYLVAITGSASGYDVEQYLADVAHYCTNAAGCVLEAANELGHSSQSAQVNDVRGFESIAVRAIPSGSTWALGAMLGQDEPVNNVYPPTGVAPFSTAHLDRSRDKWNQVRRVREIAAISETTGKPAISGEPIGAAEVSQPQRRESDPNFFFAYGALCRLFELGACVLHSEDGLFARSLGPVQTECARAFLDGYKSIDTDVRLSYRNAGWTGNDVPVASFTGAVRVYSGVFGTEGYTVVVGDEGVQVEWKNGYHVVAELARKPGVIVWKIAK